MTDMRKETDSLGVVEVAADKLWGAQTQRSLEHFGIENEPGSSICQARSIRPSARRWL